MTEKLEDTLNNLDELVKNGTLEKGGFSKEDIEEIKRLSKELRRFC